MPISDSDLLFLLSVSGGGPQSDPNDSFGGEIATTEVQDDTLHNVFDKVTGDEALAGKINYRVIYVKNNHGSLTLEDAILWIQSNTTNSEIAIAKSNEGVGNGTSTGVVQRPADEDTAPTSITFTQPATKLAGILLGDLDAGEVHGIHERRTIGAATPGENAATFQIKVEGDTQQ